MNNERYNQIIDEVYKNYYGITNEFQQENPIDDLIIKTLRGEMIKIEDEDGADDYRLLTQEEFIIKCKTDKEFSDKWGLKIEERELSDDERATIYWRQKGIEDPILPALRKDVDATVPTKLITVTYNNEKIYIQNK